MRNSQSQKNYNVKNKITICSPYFEMMVYGPKKQNLQKEGPKETGHNKSKSALIGHDKAFTWGMRLRKVCSFWDSISKQVRSGKVRTSGHDTSWARLGQDLWKKAIFGKLDGWISTEIFFLFPEWITRPLLYREKGQGILSSNFHPPLMRINQISNSHRERGPHHNYCFSSTYKNQPSMWPHLRPICNAPQNKECTPKLFVEGALR